MQVWCVALVLDDAMLPRPIATCTLTYTQLCVTRRPVIYCCTYACGFMRYTYNIVHQHVINSELELVYEDLLP